MTDSIKREIKEVKKEIEETPYNKSTEEHIGRLKAKLSNLREKLEQRKSSSGGGSGYSIPKAGDRTVVLAGYPSVGKSTLLSKLTNADAETAPYDFTTVKVVPGMLEYKGAKIQILDVPGLIQGASSGRGGGKQVLSVVRNADLIIRMIGIDSMDQLEELDKELQEAGFRLNQSPPKINIDEREQGGISITSSVEQEIDYNTVKTILREYKISNALVSLREKIEINDLVDKLSGSKEYVPALIVVNKVDKVKDQIREDEEGKIYISAEKGINLDYLKEKIFEKLNLMRVYLKPKDESVDKEKPIILEKGSLIQEVAKKIHSDFKNKFQFARVWGESAKFNGQQVGLDHELEDEDIVQLDMKNI